MTRRAIDMHSHYYGGLIEALTAREARPFVSRDAEGRLTLHAMTASTLMSPGYSQIAARLAYMDAHQIETQLLTFPGALGVDVMPVAETGAAIADYNTHLADICRNSGGRFIGLAGLPLADMAQAAAEMRRAREELGLLGAILPGDYFLTIDNARRLVPVLEAANAAGALIMVHPGLKVDGAPPPPFPDSSVFRASVLNLQASLSQMALTLIEGKLAEAYPGIMFQVVNLGGTLPFVLERLEAVALSRPPHTPFASRKLQSLLYDCASLGPRALELAVRVYGADRVMLGTDYPIFTPDVVRDCIEAAELTKAQRELVLRGTAEHIFERLRL